MRIFFVLCLSLSVSGCASLHSKVFENIHEGDSKDHVVQVLGQPDQFGLSQRVQGATAWYYIRKGDICGLTLQNDVVVAMACGKNKDYRSPGQIIGKALQNTGQGMQNSMANRPATLNCTTENYGGTQSYTTCH